jgi:hypothetical protein
MLEPQRRLAVIEYQALLGLHLSFLTIEYYIAIIPKYLNVL